MKQIIKITLSLLFIAASFSSCVDDKDFDTPQIIEEDANLGTTTLVASKNALLQTYQGTPSTLVYTFPEESDSQPPLYAPAYVVSDDTTGNFYKKLIVQDKPENPTMGMEILINTGNLHTLYNVGRKIYIKLNGLTLGYLDGQQGGAPTYDNQSNPNDDVAGVYKLGVLGEGNTINRISEFNYEKIIKRTSVTETIIPTVITTSGVSDITMNTFVQIENIQFESSQIGKSFAAEVGESYDASRLMFNCDTNGVIDLMTSTFSSFKTMILPEGKGSIKGVLMKNYRENDPVIVLNTPSDIDMTDMDRCTVQFCVPDCSDSFDAGLVKWTPYSVVGAQVWETTTFGNPGPSVKISGHVGGASGTNYDNEDWLISTVIDLSDATSASFSFDSVRRYNGPDVEVYYATDYAGGDPTTDGTWVQLTAILDTNSNSWSSWTNSGDLDVSSVVGDDLYIAIKYISNSGGAATWEIDNVVVNIN
jgi:hypothetical protein